MTFIQELKRRNVFRVAIAYVVVAWLVAQVLQLVFESFGTPDWVMKTVLVLMAAGLLFALFFAWAYEITPEGIKREYEVDRSPSITHHTGRKLDFAIIGLLVLALGYFAFDKFGMDPARDAKLAEATAPAAVQEQAPVGAGKSIAVLPFKNRSSLADDAYFVDGIHDDILTKLSKIHSLTVIARTSVEQFRDTKLSVREIASRLGVTAVIEGGVQRAGDRVRINIQLIDVSNEGHLWAETYDRELNTTNVFATQTEVAAAVANALSVAFTPEEADRASSVPTANLEAWEAYQLGMHALRESTADSYDSAFQYFRRALELDPDFALAHVGLARTTLDRMYSAGTPREPALASATDATQRALAIDSDLPEGLAMFGDLLKARHEYAEAETYLLRALEIDPNSAAALESYAGLLPLLGRNAEAIEPSEKLVRLDPLDVEHHQRLAMSLFAVGRFYDALFRLDKALDVDPSSAFTYHEIGHILAALGRWDLAMPWIEKHAELDEESWSPIMWLAFAYAALDDTERADQLFDEIIQRSRDKGAGPLSIAASWKLGRGDIDGALSLAEEAHTVNPQSIGAVTTLSEIDILNGNIDQALERFELALPELLDDEPVLADIDCSCSSVPLAAVLLHKGETDRAWRLLELSEDWNAGKPRLGTFGYGISDVYIYALRGDTARALRALREAEQAGWRDWNWHYERDLDPSLDSIRGEQEFKAIFADIESDMASQRELLAARPKNSPLDRNAWKIALDREN